MRTAGLLAAITGLLAVPTVASAQVEPYGTNSACCIRDILPPGANGNANALELVTFLSTGTRPIHNADQRDLYEDLVFAVPGLDRAGVDRFFKDSTFGVKPDKVQSTITPRPDVTIVRDSDFGVPHIYGSTRAGTMFGLGYATGQDRMFFIDVLRHAGRGELSSFAGGAESNRAMDQEQWRLAPYTEADLQLQLDRARTLAGSYGQLLRDDLSAYTAGVNAYIDQLTPVTQPGEYAAIGQPAGPEPWKDTDAVAIASLVGGIFGKGGGGELQNAVDLQAFRKRFGAKGGFRNFTTFRAADDPEAPRHVFKKRFPYLTLPKKPKGTAIPDAGSLKTEPTVISGSAVTPGLPGLFPRNAFPTSASNALVVSGKESKSGHPLAVFGPQVSYFSPQILMEQDVHGPGIQARGSSFPGVNLYVQLGHGTDYSWSATSAGNDIIDTFALPLCEPGGGAPTLQSDHYSFRGECTPFEVLTRTNTWTPSIADQTPAGTETLQALRTKLGIVTARGNVKGKPVAYTKLRTTYFHEIDSAVGFAKFNDPGFITSPRAYQQAAHDIGYTFNWLYADHKQVAYFNSGNNPVRHPNANPDFPVFGKYAWKGFDPTTVTARYTPFKQHPQVINQDFIASWNGKQALGFRAADSRWNFSAVDRVDMLTNGIKAGIKGKRKMDIVGLVEAMEQGGTTDLRGQEVIPWAFRVMGKVSDPEVTSALATLRAWVKSGSHRRDLDQDGVYDHSDAVAIMDAWWPKLSEATFQPKLGKPLYEAVVKHIGLGDMPHLHQGSAFDDGIWGHIQKDLRANLGKPVAAWPERSYCGKGTRKGCRRALVASLKSVLPVDKNVLYSGDSGCPAGDQICWDAVRFRALGGITQPPINWINRPTYQQVVELTSRAGR